MKRKPRKIYKRNDLTSQYAKGLVYCKEPGCSYHEKTIPTKLRVKNKGYKDGWCRLCKDCNHNRVKSWVSKNKKKHLKRIADWREKHKDLVRDRFRAWQRKNSKASKTNRKGYIYFIECPYTKKVKIGFATDLDKRFRAYKCHSPVQNNFLLIIKGTEHEEGDYLAQFYYQKDQGSDWMTPNKAFFSLVKDLKTKKPSVKFKHP